MFAIALTGLGEDKYLTNLDRTEIKKFEDQETAELVVGLFSEQYGAKVVQVNTVNQADLREETGGTFKGTQFVAKRNEDTDRWGVWDNKVQKWAGENMNSREQARSLGKILNSQREAGAE